MEFDSDKIRGQLRHYGELAASFAKMDTKDLEAHVREFLQAKGENFDGKALGEQLRPRSKSAIDTVTELIRSEFRQEFEEVTRRGRAEVAQFIEKVVCLIEERLGPSTSRLDHEDEAAWRKNHEAQKSSPKSSEAKKATAKKSSKSSGAKKTTKKSAAKEKDED